MDSLSASWRKRVDLDRQTFFIHDECRVALPNRIRPRCPACDAAMSPLYAKGPRGKAFVRVPDVFWCPDDRRLARGRRKVGFL